MIDATTTAMMDELKLPVDIECERMVLGTLLSYPEFLEHTHLLTLEHFDDTQNRNIFTALESILTDGHTPHIVSVADYFVKNKYVFDRVYLAGITNYSLISPYDIQQKIFRLKELWIRRRMMVSSAKLVADSQAEFCDVLETLEKWERECNDINSHINALQTTTTKEELVDKIYAENINPQIRQRGIDTGFEKLNDTTQGWKGGNYILLAARPSMGKCFGIGTKIMMFDGSLKNVEDIKIGDKLMGDDSTERNVTSTCTGKEMMYWIHQNKGMDYRVNESHILSLKRSRNEWNKKHGDILNINVLDYLQSSQKFKSNYKGYKVCVEFKDIETDLEPYFMGVWLGDGTSDEASITAKSDNNQIYKYLLQYAPKVGCRINIVRQPDKCDRLDFSNLLRSGKLPENPLKKKLKEAGVYKNKHIPNNYLINSKEKRLQLLAGLIDTDGHYNKMGGYEIVQKNKRLACDIKLLCDTLGFRATLTKKTATLKSRNYSCEVYRIRFYGNIHEIPVKLSYKKAPKSICKRDSKQTGIVVKKDKIDDYYGFEIDGNKLFCLEDCTVTHNTTLAIQFALNALKADKAVSFFSLEMTDEELYDKMLLNVSNIPSDTITMHAMDEDEKQRYFHAAEYIKRSKLHLTGNKKNTCSYIKKELRRQKMIYGIDIAFIDYIGRIKPPKNNKDNRNQDVADISMELKSIALELNIPIIVLSQLNRAVETRPNKRPVLSDLRDSGALEQDADLVITLYRNHYYYPKSETNMTDEEYESCTELYILKNRNGRLLKDTVYINKSKSQFTQYYNLT